MTQIGKNIKKIRNVKGLSQQAFADLFDLTRGNISSYEESRAEPKIEAIMKIANFFSIPLADFVEKDLSVNELLHYNTHLVIETEKLKINRQLANIPYVSIPYIEDYIQHHANSHFIQKLPVLTVPCNSKLRSIAIETEDPNNLPAGFEFRSGDILIFEQVAKENIHRITNKLGMMIDSESLRFGIYQTENNQTGLYLNDWVKYPFDIRSDAKYWLLQASYKQEG
ncbi:MAG: helix-turn-helix domain-containing protein [Tannerella sp.]|jgi:transcriptional regulator with XRE-family HTH domain|nr:helix-turn-helix domain-containing protein [Tannerella sp.]